MGISAYIPELLEENEYVIIPGLGAFISTYQPAKFDGESNILLPPSRLFSFNPDLRVDDGILQHYLVQRMKITHSQAHKLIEQYSDDIVYHLQSGEPVVLDKLGILSKPGNTIHFEPENRKGTLVEAFGFDPVEAVPAGGDDGKPVSPEITTEAGKQRNKKWLIGLLLFCVLAVAALIVTQLPSEVGKEPDKKEAVPGKEMAVPSAKEAVAPGDSSALKQEGVAEDIISHGLENGLFYLIGGSFQSEKNADEYLLQMKSRGYQPVALGKAGRYFLVAIESYATESEALTALNRLNNTNPESGYWIYHPQ